MSCQRCSINESFIVMLPLAKLTESGQVVYPNETDEMSITVSVNLCFKCMVLANEGWIFPCNDNGETVLNEIAGEIDGVHYNIRFFEERYRSGELTKDINESCKKLNTTRTKVKGQKLKNAPLRIAVFVEEIMNKIEVEQSK